MRFIEIVKSAFHAIMARKTRSFLTMLGVIVGVFAVASLLAVGNASIRQMNTALSSLGAEVMEGNIYSSDYEITTDDLDAMSESELIDGLAPSVSTRSTASKGDNSTSVTVMATTTEYARIGSLEFACGRFFLPIDYEAANTVTVVGKTVALTLFGHTDIYGEVIEVGDVKLTIVGVLPTMEEAMGSNPNEQIFIPLTTGEEYFGLDSITSFVASATDTTSVDDAVEYIESYLYSALGEDEDSFDVSSAEEIQSTLDESNKIMMAMLGGIGGISLLVSGIGIMNTMLGSVRERIKEIGIRKAIGAKRKDIMIQFLLEAIVLSGLGGLLGIILTIILAKPVGALMDMEVKLSVHISLLAIVFSIVVGVVFGLQPAASAAKMDPVEALHYE